jgi:hypothetical protein
MKRSRAGATIRPNQPLGAAIRFLWSIWSSERPLLLNWVVRLERQVHGATATLFSGLAIVQEDQTNGP